MAFIEDTTFYERHHLILRHDEERDWQMTESNMSLAFSVLWSKSVLHHSLVTAWVPVAE